ncbi:hypothetical protein O181_007589 [Austropuccinia psidii MF-1]|uniref:Spc7 kinetochore protein domain-containing protein n=1 Tax=Austropuccinia psidii MF-1 TaxID=1389203 RepID=A0A9Q3GI12_9BASI|nr:hypothetical protein [Austropuccinia psidii MF-1]
MSTSSETDKAQGASHLRPSPSEPSSLAGALERPTPRLSINPPRPAKLADKKRSKSLGGSILEQHLQRGNFDDSGSLTITLELTPRKKARRSLVPGKSILKSRPTVTGLERTTSDNTLTLSANQTQALKTSSLPSFEAPASLSSQPPQLERAASSPCQPQVLKNPNSSPERTRADQAGDEPAGLDNSSDMDVSDDQGLCRTSLGSNTTNLLRRVSFAAKAHVRTFGSPIMDPDSSIVSSAASPFLENAPELAPQVAHPQADNKLPDPALSADMSIDQSLLHDQPPESLQKTTHSGSPIQSLNTIAVTSTQSKISAAHQVSNKHKASRLSMAIPGFENYDVDSDDDDLTMENLDSGKNPSHAVNQPQQQPPFSSAPQSVFPPVDKVLSHQGFRDDHDLSRSMDLTLPFQSASNPSIHYQEVDRVSRSSVVTKSAIPRLRSNTLSRPPASKSSRLSIAFPQYAREDDLDTTENFADVFEMALQQRSSRVPGTPDQPESAQVLSINQASEQTQQRECPAPSIEIKKSKKASRLTSFLGIAEDEEGNASRELGHSQHDDSPPAAHGECVSMKSTFKPIASSVNHARSLELENVSACDQSQANLNILPTQQPSTSLASNVILSELNITSCSGPEQAVSQQSLQPKPYGKQASTEFLYRDASSDKDDDLALIDLSETSLVGKVSSPKGSRLSVYLPDLGSINEEEDLMNEFHEPHTNSAFMFGPSSVSSQNPPSLSYERAITNLEPLANPLDAETPRSSSFEPPTAIIPRKSSIRTLQNAVRIGSASPARRLSDSLSGSPTKQRSSFASPRRSTSTLKAATAFNSSIGVRENLIPNATGVSRIAPAELLLLTNNNYSTFHDSNDLINPQLPSKSINEGTQFQNFVQPLPSPPPPPLPVPKPSITLGEFFEQAEIRFISLSQPRVRNHDQQEQSGLTEGQQHLSSFAQQIFASMVKIPRLRTLESSSRNLRQKTELLDNSTREHERDIEQNTMSYRLLRDWIHLHAKQNSTSTNSLASQKHMDELNELMSQLRLKKSWAEMNSKRDSLRFELDMWKAYQASLTQRTAKLSKDLELMRKLHSIVDPATETLRNRKQHWTEEIRRRKQKNAEIASCDQEMLKALKAETKDLAVEIEASRRLLAESDFERNMWVTKLSELEEEKSDHTKRIELMKIHPDQNQKCTAQELIQLKNEFITLQRLMGWELARFEDDLMEFVFSTDIGVSFHLDSYQPQQAYRNVGRIEMTWLRSSSLRNCKIDNEVNLLEEFFFFQLKANYQGKKLEGRIKDFVHQVTSIWNHARRLIYEICNLRTRFRVTLKVFPVGSSRSLKSSSRVDVITRIQSRRNQTSVEAQFELTGEEILDWKAESTISNISCKVNCLLGSKDCLNLTYIIREHIDKGNRGAWKQACEEVFADLDSPKSLVF